MNSDNNRLVHGETFATTRFLQNLVDFLAHKKVGQHTLYKKGCWGTGYI